VQTVDSDRAVYWVFSGLANFCAMFDQINRRFGCFLIKFCCFPANSLNKQAQTCAVAAVLPFSAVPAGVIFCIEQIAKNF